MEMDELLNDFTRFFIRTTDNKNKLSSSEHWKAS